MNNVVVSGSGVVKNAIDRARAANSCRRLGHLSKSSSVRPSRSPGRRAHRSPGREHRVPFGVVELPGATPNVGDSVGESPEPLDLKASASGSPRAGIAERRREKRRIFASSMWGLERCLHSGERDLKIGEALPRTPVVAKLEALTASFGGLDMVVLPGDTSAKTLAAIIADEMAIGMITPKPRRAG